jgi:predicted anti-sigma-YlaC factor YlaD
MIRESRRALSCKELVELVTDYLEGRMSRLDRRRFERHLRGCSYCSAYLEQMRQVIRVLGRLTEESISPRAREELLVAFRDWKSAW